jgi:antitoxin component of MazEF toxin-antitoxin module
MKIVNTRKVGNSVVVTLPPELGYEAGIDVLIDRAPNGDLRIMPAARLHDVLRERARQLIQEDAEALAILEEHVPSRGQTRASCGVIEGEGGTTHLDVEAVPGFRAPGQPRQSPGRYAASGRRRRAEDRHA